MWVEALTLSVVLVCFRRVYVSCFMFFWCFNCAALFLSLLFYHSLFILNSFPLSHHLLSLFLSFFIPLVSFSFILSLSSCCLTFSFPLSLSFLTLSPYASLSLILRLSLSLSLWLSLSSSPFFSTSDSLALYFNLSLRLLSHSLFLSQRPNLFCLSASFIPCFTFSLSLSLSLPHVWLYQSFWLHPDCVSLSFFTSLSVPPLPQLSFFNRCLPLSLSLSVFLSVLGSHTEYGRKSSSAFSVYHHSPSVYNLIDLQPPHTHTHTHVSPKALTPRICMWISLGLPAATSILISALFMGL